METITPIALVAWLVIYAVEKFTSLSVATKQVVVWLIILALVIWTVLKLFR